MKTRLPTERCDRICPACGNSSVPVPLLDLAGCGNTRKTVYFPRVGNARKQPRGPENGVVGMSEPGSLAHCVDDNCDVNGNSCSRAGHVHQESPAACLLNGGDTVSA